MTDLKKSIHALEFCSSEKNKIFLDGDVRQAMKDAFSLLKANETRLMAREELLQGWGHGWEESWWIGDDEDPEQIVLTECVWIDGQIMMEDGSNTHADSEYWRERYGKEYAMRIWGGNTMPTDEQRRETPWSE